jgi:multidrug efflux system membrane fusion protein
MAKSQRSRWRRVFWIIIGLAIVIGVTLEVRHVSGSAPAGGSDAVNPAPNAEPVTAATATRQDVPEIIDAVGTVQSIDSVSVQPRVTGRIEKIEFTPGQDIKKGQELFLIDPRPYQTALDQAKAQLAHDQGVLAEARMDLQRYKALAKQRSIAAQTAQDQVYVVQQNEGTVALDQANVEMAQLNLDYCRIIAPIDGRAGMLQVDLGNLVGPASLQPNSVPSSRSSPSATSSTSGSVNLSTPTSTTSGATSSTGGLVSIEQLQPIYVTFSIPQTALNKVVQSHEKAPLEVRAYSQAGKLLEKGKLTVINNQVSTATGTVTLQATFVNRDEVLWPGEYVSIQLVIGVRRNVVTVPASAVMAGPNGDYVYAVGSDSTVTRIAVQQAARRGAISVIEKGVSAGQRVVTTGQYRLDNGTVVTIQKATVPQQAASATAKAGSIAPD